MLSDSKVATRLPVGDLDRAEAFYRDALGLAATDRQEGVALLYAYPGGEFELYKAGSTSAGAFTQMGWLVDDLAATMAQLRRNGVVFEEYDFPGLTTDDGVARTETGYASQNAQKGELGAWFKDSEGNMLGLVQARP